MIRKREASYRRLFILGLAFIPIGVATSNPIFIAVGGLFFIAGMAYRKQQAN